MAVILISFIFLGFSPVFASGEEEKNISGTISGVDWVTSTLTVRYFHLFSGNADEINLKVSSDAKLTRGTEAISLSDIMQGDPVTVVYYGDDVNGLKIKRLADLNRAAS